MENKHYPSNKRANKPLIIHIQNDLGEINIPKSIDENLINIELTGFKDLSHLTINSKENFFIIKLNLENIKSEYKVVRTQENFDLIIKKCFNLVNSKRDKIVSNYSIDNKIEKFFIDKIKLLDDFSKKKEDLLKLSFSVNTLPQFPQKLLELNYFNSYLSSHLIIHSKGNLNAISYDYNRSYGFKRRKIDAKKFNSIFNLIKKSKNKSFNSILLNDLDIELVGSFLAKELELPKFNIILIISRNDFLNPNKEEINYFNDFSKLLPNFLTSLISADKFNSENIYIYELLKKIQIPILINDIDGKIIFKNEEYDRKSDQLNVREKIKMNNGIELIVFKDFDSEKNTSDLFHYQRISLLGELLNTLRHELSNPLFGIKLATEVFNDENFDQSSKLLLSEISKSIERSQLIIENFSTLYTNKSSDVLSSLKKLINETLTLSKSETKGLNKYIEYIDIEENDEIYTLLNPTWFVQIIFNLIVNSSQALAIKKSTSRDNYIKIIVSRNNKNILIEVFDNGPGINQVILDKLFKPFETTKKNGTGLGLAISRNLANKMGGDLVYDYNYKNGAKFNLTIPLRQYENLNNRR